MQLRRIAAIVALAAGFVAAVSFVWGMTYTLDSPVDAVTWSNSFLTDEGFHAKWAHHRVSFGQGAANHDVTFLPVAHLHNLVVFAFFLVFGVSFAGLRFYALLVAAAGLVAFYGLARRSFGRAESIFCAVLLVTAFNFVAYARVAFAEPLAILLCILACFAYGSGWDAKRRGLLSALCAFAAISVKIHFLGFLLALASAWLFEIFLVYRAGRREEARRAVIGLAGGAAMGVLLYVAVVGPFLQETLKYHQIVSSFVLGRDSAFDITAIVRNESVMLHALPANTHSPVTLGLAFGLLLFAIRPLGRLWSGADLGERADAMLRFRVDFLMFAWLAAGLAMLGSISYQPPRYFLFALIPLSYAAARIVASLPGRKKWVGAAVILALHLATQAPYFSSWLSRAPLDSHHAALGSIAATATSGAGPGEVRVIGASAAMLALFDSRIRSIHPEFYLPSESICDRFAHWQPRYALATEQELGDLISWGEACGTRVVAREVERAFVRDGRSNELILSELSYGDGGASRASASQRDG